ncbi:MAG TPA: hypothetical protein VJV79_14890 [Polyangiaceae bacterium]|nr:hypothetical protein [Polyangiaceae bacterium]
MQSAILDRIVELWGVTEPGFDGHVMNEAVAPATIWDQLIRDFGNDATRVELVRYLMTQGQREIQEAPPEPDDMFLIGSCFELCKAFVDLDVATTQHLLWTFPPVGYYREMRVLARRRFDQAQLLHVLAQGIRSAQNDMMRACSTQGLQAYIHEVKTSSDVSFCAALADFEAALRPIVGASHEIVAETSEGALKVLWEERATRNCPRLDPAELTAYRVQEETTVYHTVERGSDGYIVLQIPRCEVVERTLVLEYVNREPSLLPKDVPETLAQVLLPTHFPSYVTLDQITFVDLVVGRTVERAPSARNEG